jgi:hypothetical protein
MYTHTLILVARAEKNKEKLWGFIFTSKKKNCTGGEEERSTAGKPQTFHTLEPGNFFFLKEEKLLGKTIYAGARYFSDIYMYKYIHMYIAYIHAYIHTYVHTSIIYTHIYTSEF